MRCGANDVRDALKLARASLQPCVAGTPKLTNCWVSAPAGDAGCTQLSMHDEGADGRMRSLHNAGDIVI